MVIHQFNRLIKNKWVWGAFAVAISVFFAFDFLFTGRGEETSSGSAGKLGDEDVKGQTFQRLASEARGFGRGRDNSTPAHEINRRTWQTLAALAVAKKSSMEASDDDVRAAIRRDRSFFGEDGAFNMGMYEMLLRENGRGGQKSDLISGLYRFKRGAQRNFRLSETDVSA